MIRWDIQVKRNVFYASCSLDLRWRDAVIVQARGPLRTDIGGTFGTETYAEEFIEWIDGLTIVKTWTGLADAQAWIDTIENRLQVAMAALRVLYEQYPTTFAQRTRTV
jgi:hypothetical protein